MNALNTLIDRLDTTNIKNLDRMLVELSPHMTEFEIDRVVEFMNTISNSRWDINPTISESASQIKLIVGSERYEQIKGAWATKNQHLISDGITKYRKKSDGSLWDGLDVDDDPNDYERIVM